ncbi:ATPase family AAA domain containing protein 3-B, partial [Dissostichus eleginoides]
GVRVLLCTNGNHLRLFLGLQSPTQSDLAVNERVDEAKHLMGGGDGSTGRCWWAGKATAVHRCSPCSQD